MPRAIPPPTCSTRPWPRSPRCLLDYPVTSTRQLMRELNRLGVTSAIDTGGGFQIYPEDYLVIQQLADNDQLTVAPHWRPATGRS